MSADKVKLGFEVGDELPETPPLPGAMVGKVVFTASDSLLREMIDGRDEVAGIIADDVRKRVFSLLTSEESRVHLNRLLDARA